MFQAHANRSRDSTNLLCPGRNPDYSTRIPTVKKEFELVTKTKQGPVLAFAFISSCISCTNFYIFKSVPVFHKAFTEKCEIMRKLH